MAATMISNGVTPTNGAASRDMAKDNRPSSAALIRPSQSQNNGLSVNGNGNNGAMHAGNPSSMSRSTSSHNSLAASLVNRPSLIEYKNYRFLIMDAPTENNVHAYIDILKKKNVVAVVRACEPTYQVDALLRNNIKVLEAPFPDGDPPSDHIIGDWLALVRTVFADNASSGAQAKSKVLTDLKATPAGTVPTAVNGVVSTEDSDKKAVAVHCVAGLGRAPVLVAIALIDAGMPPIEVIDFIRKRRRGAFNSKQLKYIQSYKPPRSAGKKGGDCVCM